jgi:hypothetical protein
VNRLNRYLVRMLAALGRHYWIGWQRVGSLELGYWPSSAAPTRPPERGLSGPPPGHPERLVSSTVQAPIEESLRDLLDFLDEVDGLGKLDELDRP